MKKLLALFTVLISLLVSTGVWAQGTIDNSTIGLITPQAGKFTNLEATTQITLGSETITNFSGLDDDKVKASPADITPGFLGDKIEAGTGIDFDTSDPAKIIISAPPVNVEDSADGVEITFANEFDNDPDPNNEVLAIDINGTDLFQEPNNPTITVGGVSYDIQAKGPLSGGLQEVIATPPSGTYRAAGHHKLKLMNANGFSEGLIYLSRITPTSPILSNHGTGLVGYWPMDGDFQDHSASGNSSTANGDVTTTATDSIYDQAGSFDGVDDYVVVSNDKTAFQGAKTVIAWFKTSTAIVNIIANQAGTFAQSGFHFSIGGTGKLRVFSGVGGVGTQFDILSPANVTDNEWHMGAFTWDGTTNTNGVKLYLDGIEVAQGTSNFTDPAASTNFLTIGNDSGGTGHFNGPLDDIAIYDIALSANDISEIYNGN